MADGNETLITTPSDREIMIESTFDAPRELLWRAYTDPNLIPEWWGPKGYSTVIEKLDFKKGGEWRFISKGPDGKEDAFSGKFAEIVEPEWITWTFAWEELPGSVSRETISFEDLSEGKTRVISRTLHFTKEERDGMLESGMEKGVKESNDRLAELLERLKEGTK